METVMAFVVGILAAGSVYMMLSRDLVRVLFGVILLSNAANFVIFAAGRMTEGALPLIPEDALTLTGVFANPLPQALILTAIVISFGLLAFLLVLVYRGHQELGTVDGDSMRAAEPLWPGEEPASPAAWTVMPAEDRVDPPASPERRHEPRPQPEPEPVDGRGQSRRAGR